RVRLAVFLPGDLPFARHDPVDEKLSRVRMRRAVEHRHAAGAAAHNFAFLQRMREEIDGKTLLRRAHDRLRAADIKVNFSLTEPIGALFEVSRDENIGLGQKPRDEARAERRRVVKKYERLAAAAGGLRIEGPELAFESRLQQIPPRLDLVRIEKARVVGAAARPDLAAQQNRALVLRVGEPEFFLPPTRLVIGLR